MPQVETPPQDGACLQAEGLACVRNDRVLFEALHFRLEPGEIVLIEGPNGSGKSSLLRILCGIRLQDDGDVLWGGTPVEKLGPEYHAELAYVGHHDGVKLGLTPIENLRITRAMGRPSATSIDEVLERLGLYDHGDVLAGSLSAGQRRRLALGRLLATENRLWILDEPLTSLDRQGARLFVSLVEEFATGGGMVVMTSHHDLELGTERVQKINLGA
jgi:heme exporter protein A